MQEIHRLLSTNLALNNLEASVLSLMKLTFRESKNHAGSRGQPPFPGKRSQQYNRPTCGNQMVRYFGTVLPIVSYTGRLRPKRVPFSSSQYVSWIGSDRIGLTKPGSDRTGLTKPGSDRTDSQDLDRVEFY